MLVCGHCKAGTFCEDVSGICPDGCSAGYEGDICDQGIHISLYTRYSFKKKKKKRTNLLIILPRPLTILIQM